jgi:5-methylcytosine-specific restriction endonuclease McrA
MPTQPPVFRPPHARSRQQQVREYEARRGNERQRGYTKALRNAMAHHKRSHPLCVGCQAIGRVTAAEVTDHVIPARGDHALLWDQGNWQSVCRRHHDVIKQRLERMYEHGDVDASALRIDSATAIRLSEEAGGW